MSTKKTMLTLVMIAIFATGCATTIGGVDHYWIDYNDLKKVSIGMTRTAIELGNDEGKPPFNGLGEPQQLIKRYVNNKDKIEIVLYRVKEKTVPSLPGITRPTIHQQYGRTFMWGEAYFLMFHYRNDILELIEVK